MEPFIVEFQVYDYLIKKELIGVVEPNCYDWLTASKAQKNLVWWKLRKSFDWRRGEDTITMKDPIRGLLFEYVERRNIDEAYVTEAEEKSLWDQLNHLHSLYIVNGNFYIHRISWCPTTAANF
jgi:hypothetical protein